VNRKKKQQASHHLQASSRQTVQESVTVTAMARPLNLSTMVAPLTMKEVVFHSAEKMLELILDEFQ